MGEIILSVHLPEDTNKQTFFHVDIDTNKQDQKRLSNEKRMQTRQWANWVKIEDTINPSIHVHTQLD